MFASKRQPAGRATTFGLFTNSDFDSLSTHFENIIKLKFLVQMSIHSILPKITKLHATKEILILGLHFSYVLFHG